MLAHDRGGLHRGLDVVDGEHEKPGFARFCRLEQLQARSVAVVHLAAEAPHEIHLLIAHFEGRERHAAHAQNARNDLPHTPVTGDDDRVTGACDRVELGSRTTLDPAREQALVQLEQRWRQEHRDRDHDHEEFARACFDYAERACRSEKDEGKLPALRDREREPLRGFVRRAADSRDRVHQDEFRGREPRGEAEHRERPVPHQHKVGAHPHRDEEEPEEQTLERLDISLELVAKLGVGEEHPCEESAERSGQADFLHDERGAYHEQQRSGSEYLTSPVTGHGL